MWNWKQCGVLALALLLGIVQGVVWGLWLGPWGIPFCALCGLLIGTFAGAIIYDLGEY